LHNATLFLADRGGHDILWCVQSVAGPQHDLGQFGAKESTTMGLKSTPRRRNASQESFRSDHQSNLPCRQALCGGKANKCFKHDKNCPLTVSDEVNVVCKLHVQYPSALQRPRPKPPSRCKSKQFVPSLHIKLAISLSKPWLIAAAAAIGNTVASVSRVPYEVAKQKLQMGLYDSTWSLLRDLIIPSVSQSRLTKVRDLLFRPIPLSSSAIAS
jgi:hypothetical protein